MTKPDKIEIHDNIKPYLNEIAKRLWSGHAAIMVGAGFSKNAKLNTPSSREFPDWTDLGDLFYQKLYASAPDSKGKYLNVLKLADEVEAAFGRPVLDKLLCSSIPDKENKPSELHIKLLELPWTDVFTDSVKQLLQI